MFLPNRYEHSKKEKIVIAAVTAIISALIAFPLLKDLFAGGI